MNSTTKQEIDILTYVGKVLINKNDIANCLNDHFSTVGEKLISNPHKRFKSEKINNYVKSKINDDAKFSLYTVTNDEVLQALKNLDITKSTGTDGVEPRILKLSRSIVASPLAHIINLSLYITTGIRPVNSPATPLLPLPVSISPLSQYSEHSLETDYPYSYLSDEFLSLNQLRDPYITYLLTPSPKLVLPTYLNTANNEQMGKLANCRKFRDYPNENAAIFISEFESYATLHNISTLHNNRKIAALHLLLHLTGPALTWFNALSSEHKSSWDSIVQLFQTKYVDLDWESPIVMLDSEIMKTYRCCQASQLTIFDTGVLSEVFINFETKNCSKDVTT
ncbi:unnamed protein product [Mytilus coruscus]|uniref:Retrotransposon gag domain-containing protein n=1 Tax=Mytilus coruscus TaxID=42192 RepID=A0A6J8ETH6_MYTCO|nr:unnamed protein product [Mytilus coruscus]